AEIMDAPIPGSLGGTFAGNPIACAAAIAVYEEIETQDFLTKAQNIGASLLGFLKDLASKQPAIGDVRGIGAMVAIELIDPETKAPNQPLTKAIVQYAAARGLLVLDAGIDGNI